MHPQIQETLKRKRNRSCKSRKGRIGRIQKHENKKGHRKRGIWQYIKPDELKQTEIDAVHSLLLLSAAPGENEKGMVTSTPLTSSGPTPKKMLISPEMNLSPVCKESTPTRKVSHPSNNLWRGGSRCGNPNPGRYAGHIIPVYLRKLKIHQQRYIPLQAKTPRPNGSPARPRPPPMKRDNTSNEDLGPNKREVATLNGKISVVDIPGNGHCLFLAISHQLYGHEVQSVEHVASAQQLRESAADYIEANIKQYYQVLCVEADYWIKNVDENLELTKEQKNLSLFDIPDLFCHQTPIEEQVSEFNDKYNKIIQYLKKLKTGSIWGSHECIAAIAKKFQIGIKVYKENGEATMIQREHESIQKIIHISHRKFSEDSESPDHFDSVLHPEIPVITRPPMEETTGISISHNTDNQHSTRTLALPLTVQSSRPNQSQDIVPNKELEPNSTQEHSVPLRSLQNEANRMKVQEQISIQDSTTPRLYATNPSSLTTTTSQENSDDTIPDGWIMKHTGAKSVAALLDDNLQPLRRVYMQNNETTVEVHGLKMEGCHEILPLLLRERSLTPIINAVNKYKVCPGIANPDYKYLWPNCSVGIIDKQEGDTCRSIKCTLLVKDSHPCPRCVRLRDALKLSHHRHKGKENTVLTCPERKNFKSMTEEEKAERVRNISKTVQKLQRAKKRIKEKMEEMKENGVDLKDLHKTFKNILQKHSSKMTPLQSLFWKEQVKALTVRGSSGMRWNPMMIRLAIYLEAKSSGCYEALRKTKVVRLPCKTTLRDYTDLVPEELGVRKQNIMTLKDKCKDMPANRMYFSLMTDEMTIRENIVFHSKSGNLIGFVNLSQIEEEIERIDSNESAYQPKTAKKMLVYMVKCLAGSKDAKQVVGMYETNSATAQQIYSRTWSVIEALEMEGIKVLCVVCDGASTNRSFFRFHSRNNNAGQPVFQTPNIYSEDGKRPLFFISDVPHLLKCIRNNFSNNTLWNNGQDISWDTITSLYNNFSNRTYRKSSKLTEAHVKLTNFSKMKVYLAAQVLSSTVATNLELLDKEKNREIVKFIRIVDKFFDCLNGHSHLEGKHAIKPELDPYRDVNDTRFNFLKEDFVKYLEDWRKNVKRRPGPFTASQRKAMTITDETFEGILINGFAGAVRFLLHEGVDFVLANHFCQDDLEHYFSHQRGCGRLNNNPTLKEALHNDTKILKKGEVAARINTGNTRWRAKAEIQLDESRLARKKRIRV